MQYQLFKNTQKTDKKSQNNKNFVKVGGYQESAKEALFMLHHNREHGENTTFPCMAFGIARPLDYYTKQKTEMTYESNLWGDAKNHLS